MTSLATASGNDQAMEGRFNGDPYCAPVCAGCGAEWPETRVEGIGPEAVRCANCGADATPFTFTNGYTIAFDELRTVGLTVPQEAAESFAREAARFAALPDNSVQNPILTFAPHDIVGLATRLRPFMGQIGTSPSIAIPDSHNAGDFGSFLIGAPHRYALSAAELQEHKTDGHMDVDSVRAGAILVCPVKVPGGGVYLGDMHALQGDGEIAGHTCDVSGTVTLQVEVLKGVSIDGPVLFPLAEDLPFLAKPLSAEEQMRALALGRRYGVSQLEESLPISVIGTGPDLNSATDNGLARAAELLQVSVPEIMNRATISGAIEIGRHPGCGPGDLPRSGAAARGLRSAWLRHRTVWDGLSGGNLSQRIHKNVRSRSTVGVGAGPAARILNPGSGATDGVTRATRRRRGLLVLTAGSVSYCYGRYPIGVMASSQSD